MPPDVAAQIAEQTFTCVEGDSTVFYPTLMADIAQGFTDSVASACIDPAPAMTLTVGADAASSDIVISDYPVACSPIATVPYATEAADVSVYFADGYSINLSPVNVAKIFNGEITTWADKALATDNPDTTLPDEPIVVRRAADKNALTALSAWFERFGAKFNANFDVTEGEQPFEPLAEGEIAILPHSVAIYNAVMPVSIIVGQDAGAAVLAVADSMGIGSAATQWVAKQEGNNVTVKLNFDQAPVPMSGFDSASTPYQAIYPVYLNICGEESLTKRANAFFLLRLDSQGSLGASSFNQLSENVRVVSVVTVRKGLPTPSAAPSE
jgi:hypothetical protein